LTSSNLVIISSLHKTFGKVSVLNGVNISVKRGEVISLIGASGSGKTTLLRCLNLLEEPTSGKIEIDGRVIFDRTSNGKSNLRLRASDINTMRSKTGMVFQHFNLFPHMNVLQNVMEGPRSVLKEPAAENKARAMEFLNKVGMTEFFDRMPNTLSGGQQQRVSIARALNMQPKIMLFDEPTSSLDPELVGEVLSTMISLAKEGITMLVVTHELGFALAVADRVIFLDQGKISVEGPPLEVLRDAPNERIRSFVNRFHETAKLMQPLLKLK